MLIAEYMIRNRGSGRGSMITGRSMHNQRIERLWRDVFTSCVSYFYCLFRAMELESILNPDSPANLLALHCVYLPIIQQQLDSFREGWCHHRLRTEHNYSPHQLWIMSMQAAGTDSQEGDEEVFRVQVYIV